MILKFEKEFSVYKIWLIKWIGVLFIIIGLVIVLYFNFFDKCEDVMFLK